MVRAILIFMAVLLIDVPANACAMLEQQNLDDISEADAIFSARVVSYKIVPHPRYEGAEFALFKLDVDRSFRGDLKGIQHVRWHNSTFGLPQAPPTPDFILVAVDDLDNRADDLAQKYPLQIFQRPCSAAFIFPYDRKLEERVWQAANGTVPWSTLKEALYTGSVFPAPGDSASDEPRDETEKTADLSAMHLDNALAILVAVFLFGLVGYIAFRVFRPNRGKA